MKSEVCAQGFDCHCRQQLAVQGISHLVTVTSAHGTNDPFRITSSFKTKKEGRGQSPVDSNGDAANVSTCSRRQLLNVLLTFFAVGVVQR